jgi:hypothetical protein
MLQYLDDSSCSRAIGVLGQASKGLLFIEVPTTADRAGVIDADRTDMDVHWRAGDWYRHQLDPLFVEIGGGLWASRVAAIRFFELEVTDPTRRPPVPTPGSARRAKGGKI